MRVSPPDIRVTEEDTRDEVQLAKKEVQLAKKKNLVRLLARMSRPEVQNICSWTGFNILTVMK